MEASQRLVEAFHRKFGIPVSSEIKVHLARRQLRADLIAEEAAETIVAIGEGNIVEVADGLADLIYVCLGAALEFGIDLAPVFREVHRTNMAKEGGATRAVGKLLKPRDWKPPRIAELLGAQAARQRQDAESRAACHAMAEHAMDEVSAAYVATKAI